MHGLGVIRAMNGGINTEVSNERYEEMLAERDRQRAAEAEAYAIFDATEPELCYYSPGSPIGAASGDGNVEQWSAEPVRTFATRDEAVAALVKAAEAYAIRTVTDWTVYGSLSHLKVVRIR